MELSLDAISDRLIIVITGLSVLITLGGVAFFRSSSAIPFATAVALTAVVNIAKVLLLKRTVSAAANMEAFAAKRHIQLHSFLRMVISLAILFGAAFLFSEHVNILGIILGILTFPVAFHSMRFFVKDTHPEIIAISVKANPAQDAVNDINATVSASAELEKKDNKVV